jgi:hypothetical protein
MALIIRSTSFMTRLQKTILFHFSSTINKTPADAVGTHEKLQSTSGDVVEKRGHTGTLQLHLGVRTVAIHANNDQIIY